MKLKSGIFMDILKTVIGCALFALGFDVFLQPNHLNSGGISGVAMIFSVGSRYSYRRGLGAVIGKLFATAAIGGGVALLLGWLLG